ncbi:hydantoinase/oxoprolinase family protein [Sphingomonas crocodyli]|uniref:Hydantoinase/oxoprolinase family protein n=1 Tax=Sphingomonas crocodyli TaxID=1979270 RepID=A0A437M790_9SPHN|nr:hydantoinase/oxoprolinase family protein [Sphingomonas crocodyli]RVT93497.1 hydantoinase/oxoprolinase family protein [Sphingomonas crocodyli]
MRVATDVGGTFTDLVAIGPDGIVTAKADTTPPNFDQGVLHAIDRAGLSPETFAFFAHGTTVVINALLSRTGSKTALITTRGFRDVLEIARGNRPDLFNFAFKKPAPFVPRYLRFEMDERIGADGEIIQPIDLASLEAIGKVLEAEGVEAVAVCFLHSYANAEHEASVCSELRALWPNLSVVGSYEVCREWREYERTSTTVLSAYVHPIAKRYLGQLEAGLQARGLCSAPYIMQSNGGVTTVQGARHNPIALVESGPASGVLGAAALGRKIGEPNLIALDIGGTTAKTALIRDGQARITTDYKIEWHRTNPGYPIRTPVVDLVEIGNGGGSIAWIDDGGRLHVGPKSAGSTPGPAAYGRGGTEPTTTDANLVLGRINPKLFLGGEQAPDIENVQAAFQRFADRMGGSVQDIARGVIRIANANMVNALKLVSLNRGFDPRDFALIAFGGGGAMHAVSLGKDLLARKVIIPANSAVFSAWGMLMSDIRRDFLMTRVEQLATYPTDTLNMVYGDIEAEAQKVCADEGMDASRLRFERFADIRYCGQDHTVKVPMAAGLLGLAQVGQAVEDFHAEHEREYKFRLPNDVELVNYHVVAFNETDKLDLPPKTITGATVSDALSGRRVIDFDVDGVHESAAYDLNRFEPGMEIAGPAVIEDKTTTIVINPGCRATMDAVGNIHIELGN